MTTPTGLKTLCKEDKNTLSEWIQNTMEKTLNTFMIILDILFTRNPTFSGRSCPRRTGQHTADRPKQLNKRKKRN